MNYLDSIKTANEIWRKIVGQATGILSIIIFDATLTYANKPQVGIVTTVACFSYMAADKYLRKLLIPKENEKTEIWRVVLVDIFDFFFSTCIFLITQWLTYFIINQGGANSGSLAEKITGLAVLIMIYALLATIFKELEEGQVESESHTNTFTRVWTSIFGTTVQFFSTGLLSLLINLPNRLEVAVGTFVVLATYITVDWSIRGVLKKIENTPERKVFFAFLIELLDIGYTMTIFVPIFYFGAFLEEQERTGMMSFAEQITSIVVAALVLNSIFEILSDFSKGNTGETSAVDAAYKIWYKISGTVYGVFGQIFSLQVSLNSNRDELIFIILLGNMTYLSIDGIIRRSVKRISNKKTNKEWLAVINGSLDFFLAVSLLIPLDYYSTQVSDQFTGDAYSFSEKIASVFGAMLIVYPIFSFFKVLSKDYKQK